MKTSFRRSMVVTIAAALCSLTMLANSSTACSHVTVNNNIGCDLRLCLYSATGAAPVCFSIPAGGPTFITFPAGFVPVGAVSASGATFPFGANGCTDCISFITTGPVRCCGVVCYDDVACTIDINLCTQAHCNP